MRTISIFGMFFCLALPCAILVSANPGSATEKSVKPSFVPPFGRLGLPFGTFAVVEGTYHPYVKVDGFPRDFRIEIVNGKKLGEPVEISAGILISNGRNMITGKRYLLHGYENAVWVGAPLLPPGESESIESDWAKHTPGSRTFSSFALQTNFQTTSIEKEDGVPASRRLSGGTWLSTHPTSIDHPPICSSSGHPRLPAGDLSCYHRGCPEGPDGRDRMRGARCERKARSASGHYRGSVS